MGEYNKKRCAICNTNSDVLKNLNYQRVCPSCYDREMGRIDCFSVAPFTMGGMPVVR